MLSPNIFLVHKRTLKTNNGVISCRLRSFCVLIKSNVYVKASAISEIKGFLLPLEIRFIYLKKLIEIPKLHVKPKIKNIQTEGEIKSPTQRDKDKNGKLTKQHSGKPKNQQI